MSRTHLSRMSIPKLVEFLQTGPTALTLPRNIKSVIVRPGIVGPSRQFGGTYNNTHIAFKREDIPVLPEARATKRIGRDGKPAPRPTLNEEQTKLAYEMLAVPDNIRSTKSMVDIVFTSGKKASIDVTSKSSTDVLHSFLTAAGLDEVVVDGAVQRTKEWIAQDRIEAQEHRRAVERSKIHKQQQAHAQKDEALVRKIFSSTESELFLKAADD
ncbi:hypothetical protein H696_04196 [Fonticula alba]|uniref:Uncharacterized protein n=1 Tax=Fonticula alba TaxID=691883 RepID=A0A058Z5G4_FONAL|nr:hypothetical protein H696_04196 [Fonticula alba]KCV68777.1 hypothetical protein H696_04196 [Fonticula alba]|eukprot:XP_009496348.1 hypothetical protein H696_04196 [Fonticula alba]